MSTANESESQTNRFYWIGGIVAAIATLGLLATAIDCDAPSGTGYMQTIKPSGTPGLTSFNKAMDLLENLSEYESEQAQESILRNLLAWLRDSDPVVEWVADPMAQRLPQNYRGFADISTLSKSGIELFDVQVLREASWLRDIAQAVLQENVVPPDLAELIAASTSSVDPKSANDLDAAIRLFDWVVRNIQTDNPVEKGSNSRYGSDIILATWRSLLFGHGTSVEKSRIFILLGRQVGLDIVMLGIEAEQGDPRNWVPALFLDGELYPFEMKYGTPILSKDGVRVATLGEVIEDPSLLSRFDMGDIIYRTRRKDLSNVVAMIDATPAYLSQRMKMIEEAMSGQNRMILTVTPTPLSKRLRGAKGVNRVEIWTFPYEMYARAQDIDNQTRQALAVEEKLFDIRLSFASDESGFGKQFTERTRNVDTRVSLIQGRLLHFKGRYETDPDGKTRGAQAHYFECRTPNADIAKLTETPIPDSLSDEEKAAARQALDNAKRVLSVTKEHATYWLGVMAFDRGNYQVSCDWLERYLSGPPPFQWQAGAHYNLGRAYEALARTLADKTQADDDTTDRSEIIAKAKAAYEFDQQATQAAQSRFRLELLRSKLP